MKKSTLIMALILFGICIVGIAASSAANVECNTHEKLTAFGNTEIEMIDQFGEHTDPVSIKAYDDDGNQLQIVRESTGHYNIKSGIFASFHVHILDQEGFEYDFDIPWHQDYKKIFIFSEFPY